LRRGGGGPHQSKTFGSKVKSLSTLHVLAHLTFDYFWVIIKHWQKKLLVYLEGTLSSRISPPQEVKNFFKLIVCSNGHFFLSAILGLFFHHLLHIKGKSEGKKEFANAFMFVE
jgi:hypothetical protein